MVKTLLALISAVAALTATGPAVAADRGARWTFSYGDTAKNEMTVVEILDGKEHEFKAAGWNCFVADPKIGIRDARNVECDWPNGPSMSGGASCAATDHGVFHAVLMGPHASPVWAITLECKR